MPKTTTTPALGAAITAEEFAAAANGRRGRKPTNWTELFAGLRPGEPRVVQAGFKSNTIPAGLKKFLKESEDSESPVAVDIKMLPDQDGLFQVVACRQ